MRRSGRSSRSSRGSQGQVVVLHEDLGARRGLLGQRLGEGPVVGLVDGPLAPEAGVEDRRGRRRRRAGGGRTTASSWRWRCTPGGTSPGRCRASARPGRRCRGRPGRAGRPGARRAAARSPSESAAQTQTTSAWPCSPSPIDDRPDTRPPPPRLATSEPSSHSTKDSGPRLEATSRSAPVASPVPPAARSAMPLIMHLGVAAPVAAVLEPGEALEDVVRRRVARPQPRPHRGQPVEGDQHRPEADGVLRRVPGLVHEQPGPAVRGRRRPPAAARRCRP